MARPGGFDRVRKREIKFRLKELETMQLQNIQLPPKFQDSLYIKLTNYHFNSELILYCYETALIL